MYYKHLFQWNIPIDNHYLGRPDWFIDVIAQWDGTSYFNGKPSVFIKPFNLDFVDLRQVKDWELATQHIQELAQNHFAEIARKEKIAQARATLISEGEPTGVPTLDRHTEAMHDLIIQENDLS